MTIKTVLFDLDGTIIDTEPAAADAVSQCFKNWGISVTIDDSRFVTGKKWSSAFDYLFRKYQIPLPPDRAADQILEAYRSGLAKHLPVVAGSVEAVRSIAQDFRLALVSGSHRSEIIWSLKKLGIFDEFEFVLGAEDYPQSKPAPDGYVMALERMGCDARNSLVFEDSEAGIDSAIAAGTWVTAIAATNHFNQDTQKAHAVIQDFTGITGDWVKALGKKLLNG